MYVELETTEKPMTKREKEKSAQLNGKFQVPRIFRLCNWVDRKTTWFQLNKEKYVS